MTVHARITDLQTRIALPMPPSLNNMFVNVAGRGRVKSANYRNWQTEAGWMLKAQRPRRFEEPVRVVIELNPPNKRLFDLDNRIKAVLDLLVEHSIIPDDNRKWVREKTIREVESGAPCTVMVEAL